MQDRTCHCGSPFTVPHPSSKRLNCSAKCRGVKNKRRSDAGQRRSDWVTITCPCGNPFDVPTWEAQGKGRKYCSDECRAKYRVKGSGRPRREDRERYIDDQGYVRVYVPLAERPGVGSWGRKSHQPEHRVVMRRMLGRDLRPNENVHHKNGVKTDNRPENLELWVNKQPKGQRVSDLLAFAKEVIALYGSEREGNPDDHQ